MFENALLGAAFLREVDGLDAGLEIAITLSLPGSISRTYGLRQGISQSGIESIHFAPEKQLSSAFQHDLFFPPGQHIFARSVNESARCLDASRAGASCRG